MNKEIESKYLFKDYDSIASLIDKNKSKQKRIIDEYYDFNDILKNANINLRKRNNIEYTVKKIVNDKDMYLDRIEENFDSLESALEFINNKLNIKINKVYPVMTLDMIKIKYVFNYEDALVEMSIDKCRVNDKEFNMLEFEILSGSNVLNSIDKYLDKDIFTLTNMSKKEIGENLSNLKKLKR